MGGPGQITACCGQSGPPRINLLAARTSHCVADAMSRKKSPLHPPRPQRGAELILKCNLESSSGYTDMLASGVFILGNRDGWRWLSDYFSWLANGIKEDAAFHRFNPDHHQHLNFDAPLNKRLSDELGITVGSFSNKNRKRVLQTLPTVRKQHRLPGNPVTQFRSLLPLITEWLASEVFSWG